MISYRNTQTLTNDNIAALVEECISAYEKTAGKRATNTIKLSLTIEEILLNFQSCYGLETPCQITLQKISGKIEFSFKQQAPQQNPLIATDSISSDILSRMGMAPRYSYESKSNSNIVALIAEQKPQKNKTIIQILIALVLAIASYFIISLLPEATQTLLTDTFIGPLFSKMTAVIAAIATPLVFFAVVNGIADIGDVSALGQIGKKFIIEVIFVYLVAGAVSTVISILAYGLSTSAASGSSSFISQIVQLVLDIVPGNLIMPFSTDNDLQVVVIAVFLGVALILMQKKSVAVKEALAVCGEVINQMMSVALKLIPFIVYLGILNILCKKMQGLGRLYIMFVGFIASAAFVVAFVTVRACIKTKTPFKVLFKKQLPTTMINLTTSSQVSALPENMVCCKKKFGIDEKLVDFGLPLGVVINMPNGASFFIFTAWALAALAGIPMTIVQAIIIMIMAIIVAIAAPPIPGSVFTVLPIFMTIAGISNEYYPVAIIAGTILGYFLPVLNGYCLQLQLLLVSKNLDMVNLETLRKPID